MTPRVTPVRVLRLSIVRAYRHNLLPSDVLRLGFSLWFGLKFLGTNTLNFLGKQLSEIGLADSVQALTTNWGMADRCERRDVQGSMSGAKGYGFRVQGFESSVWVWGLGGRGFELGIEVLG